MKFTFRGRRYELEVKSDSYDNTFNPIYELGIFLDYDKSVRLEMDTDRGYDFFNAGSFQGQGETIPVSAYIHSGTEFYIGDKGVDEWDGAVVGAFHYDGNKVSKEDALDLLKEAIEAMNDYELQGYAKVRVSRVYKKRKVKLDEVWGLLGDDQIADFVNETINGMNKKQAAKLVLNAGMDE